MLLLNSNRKSYMGNPMTLSYLALSTSNLERLNSDFEAVYLVKEQG